MSDAGNPLARAIASLAIRTVDLADLRMTLSEAFRDGEEPVDDPAALVRRGHHGVLRARQMTGTFGPDSELREIQLVRYQFFADLAVHDAIPGEDVAGDAAARDGETASGDASPEPWLFVRAEFDVEYLAHVALDEAAIVEFGRRNVAYHVWPYWREIVQSSVARTRFPVPIGVPHYLAGRGVGTEALASAAPDGKVPSSPASEA